jgi:hypothetical protein
MKNRFYEFVSNEKVERPNNRPQFPISALHGDRGI